jgi:phage regulator Rha-like protein
MEPNFNIQLLEIIDDEPRISHVIIAEYTNNNPISVRKLIDKYHSKMELFGKVSFQMTPIKNSKNRVNEEKTYFLNEPQATLLLTFLRNNEIVVKFKVDLVKVFYEMRMKLHNNTPVSKLSLSETVSQTREALELIDLLKERKGFDLLLLEKILKENSQTKL